MGQSDIGAYLKKHKTEWFTNLELSKKMGVSRGAVRCSLNRMGAFVRKRQSRGHHSSRTTVFEYSHNEDSEQGW